MNERLFAIMKKRQLDALVLCGQDNVAYVSGCDVPLPYGAADAFGNCPLAFAVVDGADRSVVLAVSSFTPAKDGVFADEVQTFEIFNMFKPVDPGAALLTFLGNIFSKHIKGARRIGVEPLRLPEGIARTIGESCPKSELVEAQAALDEARRIKQPWEIERLRHVAAIEDAGQNRFLQYAEDFRGETEFEIYAGVHLAMNKAAGHVVRISGDLATGPRVSRLGTVSGPETRRVAVGDLGIFDMSARVRGVLVRLHQHRRVRQQTQRGAAQAVPHRAGRL